MLTWLDVKSSLLTAQKQSAQQQKAKISIKRKLRDISYIEERTQEYLELAKMIYRIIALQ
jgi:hypothetical protein